MDKNIINLLAPDKKTISTLRMLAEVGSIFVLIIGLSSLITTHFHIQVSATLFPNVTGMDSIVSVGFITSSLALLLQLLIKDYKKEKKKLFAALLLSCVTLFLGTIMTIDKNILSNNNFSLDTSMSFILIGVAQLLLPIPTGKHFMRAAQGFAILAALLSMFALFSYLYQSLSLYEIFPVTRMPLSTAFTFSIFCISFLFARPDRGFVKVLTRNTPSSILALRLIIVTLTFPALLGFIVLQGEQFQLYSPQTGLILLVIGSICIFSLSVWINGSAMQKTELENLIIKNELEKKNIILEIDEKNLATKTMELEEENKEVINKLTNKEKLMDLQENEL